MSSDTKTNNKQKNAKNDPKQNDKEISISQKNAKNEPKQNDKELTQKNTPNDHNTEKEKEQEENQGETTMTPINILVQTINNQKIEVQVMIVDSVQDIRQYLLEAPETCYITSYHLEFDGNPVSDYSDLADIPNLKDGSVFKIVYDDYNETSARTQTRRFREILNMTPGSLRKESASFFTEFSKQIDVTKENGQSLSSLGNDIQVTEFYPTTPKAIKCLKKLAFSGWNSPPTHRKLMGDLFYLEVVTNEGNIVTITASPQKFFQNSTKHGGAFSPQETDVSGHNLVELLRKLSPSFNQNFDDLIKSNFESHPYELIPVPIPVKPWIARNDTHSYDPSRAEEALLATAEIDYSIQGQLRDWNEELQVCREQPKESVQDRITKDRAMFKIHTDFVQVAVTGATQIINGNVPPINPSDEPKAHLFIYNNIFFSHALDSRDFFKDLGGDTTAYKQASNDLLGVMAYNRADVKGLHTLGTALIDYKGYRLVAQTIIPGLFSTLLQDGGAINIGYGSLEGNDYKSNEDFHALMQEAATKLSLKSHIVIGKDGYPVELASHSEIKGIVGSDRRKYILDLVRTTPRDSNYLEPHHVSAILRPELIERYIVTMHEKKRNQKLEQLRKREEGKSKEEKLSEEEFLKELQEIANEKITFTIQANPDIFTKTILGDEEMEEDETTVRTLGNFLKDEVIPGLVEDMVLRRVNPVDSYTLVSLFHSRGVNMRYLGKVAKSVQQNWVGHQKGAHFAVVVMYREMISRVMKGIFSEFFTKSKPYDVASTVSNILNAFFGRLSTSDKGSRSGLGHPNSLNFSESAETTHNDLWGEIRKRIISKYDVPLPDVIPLAIFTLPTLRAICLRVGIQLASRNYLLNAEKPFKPVDITDLFPVIKHAQPVSVDGQELLEAAKVYSSSGRFDIAYELLSEALAVFHQVYGPMHEQTAQCYSHLARVLHDKDSQAAIQHQQKAVIIYERVQGLDHYDTAHAYGHLGSFSPPASNSKVGLIYLQRALYLMNTLSDPENVDNIDAYTNLGMVLQETQPKEALEFIHKALSLTENTYGPMHLLTARLCHLMARAYSNSGEYKQALSFETKNYEVCRKLLGEKDFRTMESNIWLGQLTKNAVMRAKQQLNPSKTRMETIKPKSHFTTKETSVLPDSSSLSNLPVDDLLKFIQGNRNIRMGAIPTSLPSNSNLNKRKKPVIASPEPNIPTPKSETPQTIPEPQKPAQKTNQPQAQPTQTQQQTKKTQNQPNKKSAPNPQQPELKVTSTPSNPEQKSLATSETTQAQSPPTTTEKVNPEPTNKTPASTAPKPTAQPKNAGNGGNNQSKRGRRKK